VFEQCNIVGIVCLKLCNILCFNQKKIHIGGGGIGFAGVGWPSLYQGGIVLTPQYHCIAIGADDHLEHASEDALTRQKK
jgi:hypothetical protein